MRVEIKKRRREMKSIQRLEENRLSDGGLAFISKLGNSYSVTRTFNSFTEAPEMFNCENKNQAYNKLADILRASVLEIE